jgi:uncharacterized phiE125 gp8 family phage protein
MSLVSVATLKTYLPEISGSTADTELSALLDRTEAVISAYLGFPIYDGGALHVLTTQTYTLYLDGPMYTDNSVLQLPIRPIVSITSVHSDPNLVYGTAHVIDSDEYILDKQLGRLILKPNTATNGFDTAFRAIKVVCSAGYTSANDELEHAICVYASQLHRNKSAQGKDSSSQRGSTIKYSSKDMPFEVRQLLWPLQSSTMML